MTPQMVLDSEVDVGSVVAIKRGTASRSEWLLYRIAKVSPGGNPRATLVTFDHDEVCVRSSAAAHGSVCFGLNLACPRPMCRRAMYRAYLSGTAQKYFDAQRSSSDE